MGTDKLEPYMKIAIGEAEQSLREGNYGFGAVIIKNNAIIAQAHDTEATDRDPTAHAEINAIRLASSQVGRDLSGCILLSTHEPCPMCAGAIIWAGIPHIVYGTSIADAVNCHFSRAFTHPFSKAFTQVRRNRSNLCNNKPA